MKKISLDDYFIPIRICIILILIIYNTLKQIISIEIQDEDISLLNAKVIDIISFDMPFLANDFASWQILDWRD